MKDAKNYSSGFKVVRSAKRIENCVNSTQALKIIEKLCFLNRPMQIMVDIYSADEIDVRLLNYPIRETDISL